MRKVLLTLLILAAVSPCLAKYSGGTGEPNTPYQIATKADLLALAGNRNDYSKCFILTADINMEGQVFTTPIIAADGGPVFSGTFDGNDHKITNAVINGGEDIGLFGIIGGATIKNLHLDNFTVSSSAAAAGCLAGWIGSGTISNCSATGSVSGSEKAGVLVGASLAGCTISNCYSTGSVSGSQYVGGLAGTSSGAINNCYSTVPVSGASGAGGLVGNNYGSTSNCYSTGTVNGTDYIGGLAGINSGSISNCFATGPVSGSSTVGGLVGGHSQGIINSCYSTGDVTTGDNSFYIGGLAGYNGGDINNCFSTGAVNGGENSHYLGGLAGYNLYSNISKCYSTGAVTGRVSSYYIGGLVGRSFYANINSCFFLISSGLNNGLGTPLTDAQMKQQGSFLGWDFNDIWAICETTNYPRLIWQIPAADFVCPDGVNFVDYSYLAERWLWTNCGNCGGADLTGDGIVDMLDIAVFADDWLVGL